MSTASRQAGKRTQRGFSFIEVLVTMGIIAVLAGMVVVAINIWGRKGPQFLTRQRMDKLVLGAQEIKRHFSVYAPTNPRDLYVRFSSIEKIKLPQNRTNEGIESLVLAIYYKTMKYDPQLVRSTEDGDFVNTDEDELGAPAGKLMVPALWEVRDEWENPLIYFEARDYQKYFESGATYTTSLGDDVDARPWKNEDGSYAQSDSFQLYSMGPDGLPNTEDDIKHWAN